MLLLWLHEMWFWERYYHIFCHSSMFDLLFVMATV